MKHVNIKKDPIRKLKTCGEKKTLYKHSKEEK